VGDSPRPLDEDAVARLVERAVRRDREAFGQLYDLYAERIYRYAFYRLGDWAEAEDVCGLVFLKAWQAMHRFRWEGKPFLAWLYRLAHNVVVDHFRARRPTEPLPAMGGATQEEVDLEEAVERRLTADEVVQALEHLTPEQRDVIVLRFLEGLDHAEIADILGKREGAVRALQLRGLQALRRILRPPGC
jgi:RNA polymerase sigma-70 factor (ECF subfamily)